VRTAPERLLRRGRSEMGRAPTRPRARAASLQPLVSASCGGFLSSQDGRKPAGERIPPPVPSRKRSTGWGRHPHRIGAPIGVQCAVRAEFDHDLGYQRVSTPGGGGGVVAAGEHRGLVRR